MAANAKAAICRDHCIMHCPLSLSGTSIKAPAVWTALTVYRFTHLRSR
jgi:hypothetical protein